MYIKSPSSSHPVILFDGVCNLCNGWVNFVIDRDPTARFRFASLQSDEALDLLESVGHPIGQRSEPDSILLIDGDRVFHRSDAVLRILGDLSGAWPILGAFWIIPRFIRDSAYNLIARNRYSWFGRTDACRVPEEDLMSRFL